MFGDGVGEDQVVYSTEIESVNSCMFGSNAMWANVFLPISIISAYFGIEITHNDKGVSLWNCIYQHFQLIIEVFYFFIRGQGNCGIHLNDYELACLDFQYDRHHAVGGFVYCD